MTDEQRKDAERLRGAIEREQLVSVMNDTKWCEAIAVLQELEGIAIAFRVKTVRGAAPSTSAWEHSFPWHLPRPWETIEWVDINPIVRYRRGQLLADEEVDFTEQIVQALRSVYVPFSYEETAIRIWGYVRPGEMPAWA